MNPSKRWLWAALVVVGACDLLDRRRAQDEQCLFNGDCEDPLVCAGRRCRAPCRTDRDCVGGWTCLPSGQTDRRVCLPPGEFGYCAYSADCDRPAVCQRNGVCGVQCHDHYDCRIYSAGSECRQTDHDPPLFLCTTNPDYRPVADAGADLDAGGDVDAGDGGSFTDAVTAPDTPTAPDAITAPDTGVDAGGGDGGDAAVPTDTGGVYPCPYTSEPGVCAPGSPGCDIIDFSAGKDSVDVACAAFSDGHARCWGWNLAGSFGNGTTAPMTCSRPSVVPGLRGVRAISTGNAFVCALTDTQVLCWGSNFRGNLGLGLLTGGRRSPTPQPTTLSSGSSYRLFTGMTNGCVIESGMFRVCWGANTSGQLGDGTTIDREARATILMGGAPEAVALGETHSCLRYSDGSVLCAGDNTYGQLGGGVGSTSTPTPTLVPSLSNVAEVGAGRYFTCARTNAGAVLCWGNNTGAELGNGSRGGSNPTPSPVLGLPGPVDEIAVGQLSSCARVRGTGEVYCWGSQSLGDPMMSGVGMTARAVPGLTGVQRIVGGSGFCAFLGGADLRCWGPSAGSGAGATPADPARAHPRRVVKALAAAGAPRVARRSGRLRAAPPWGTTATRRRQRPRSRPETASTPATRSCGSSARGASAPCTRPTTSALDRRVALKVMRPELSRDGLAVARFQLEARTISRLRHPHIVEVSDFGDDGGRFYLAMEFLEGESLQSLFEREGPVAPGRLVALTLPLAEALHHAHAQGVVHRDVKPDNLFLQRGADGEVIPRLVDFGIARTDHGLGMKLTGTGVMLGTPAYMAPEQVWGEKPITPAADQWSFAAVLYEGLTGRFPHQCDSIQELVLRRSTEPPAPLAELRPDLPSELCDALDRALSADPASRFPTTLALRDALAPFADLGPLRAGVRATDAPRNDTLEPPSAPRATAASTPPAQVDPVGVTADAPARPHVAEPSARAVISEATEAPIVPPAPRWPWVAAAFIALSAAATVLTVARREAERAPPAARAAPTPSPMPAPSPTVDPRPAEVVFTIDVRPSDARIVLEGESLGVGHASVRRPRGDRTYALRLEADGYEPWTDLLRADADARVSQSLVPVARPRVEPAPSARPRAEPVTEPAAPRPRRHRIDTEVPP